MPNYLRHLVAQMLIEYLDISWKEGLAWFDWTLVDADVAINSLMWQNGGHSGPDQLRGSTEESEPAVVEVGVRAAPRECRQEL